MKYFSHRHKLHRFETRLKGVVCNFALYHDDGLGITRASPWQTELIKKDLCGIYSNYVLKITIQANKKAVNFLDVTLNLSDGIIWLTSNPETHHYTSIGN